ncbi:MAG: DoxX family membrane protein [Chloroflexi bacterium]|nr:DoxX family membrane protein [Chloroflexota bacterium]
MPQAVGAVASDRIGAVVDRPWFGRAMALLRVYFGIVYLHNGLAKILPPVPGLWPDTPIGFVINAEGNRSAHSILQYEVIAQNHPIAPYRALVENVILPNFGLFGFGIGALETLVGILLVLGLLTPIAALVAAGMALHLQFATLWNDKWIYEYSVEWIPLLCLAAFRAGRWHGLDARFAAARARWPG